MTEQITQKCTECEKYLPLDMFYKNKSGKYGRKSKCKKCILRLQGIRRAEPEAKERARRYGALYRSKPEKKETAREYGIEYRARPGIKEHLKARKAMPEMVERRRIQAATPKRREQVKKHESDPEVKRQKKLYDAIYYESPGIKERMKEYGFDYRSRPKAKELRRLRDRKRRKDPKWNLSLRMSTRIRTALQRGKQGRSWTELVPYSLDELMFHLEAQFKDGMSWWNRGEWHIDHIRPIASFNFESTGDPAFKECWALENLQPLWAIDNIRKSDKWEVA